MTTFQRWNVPFKAVIEPIQPNIVGIQAAMIALLPVFDALQRLIRSSVQQFQHGSRIGHGQLLDDRSVLGPSGPALTEVP